MKLHIQLKYSDACIAYVKIEKHIQFNVFSVFWSSLCIYANRIELWL